MTNIVEDQKASWDLADIILVLTLTFGLTSLIFWGVEWGMSYLVITKSITSVRTLILNLIQASLLAGLTLYVVRTRYNISLKKFGLRIRNFSIILKYGLLGGMVICLLIIFLNNIIHIIIGSLFGITPPTQQAIQELLQSQGAVIFTAHSLLIIIVAPLTEEIFFRGLIYPYCKSKSGKVKGMILNGIIFGLAHFSPWLFFPTCVGGIILAWIYERTHSLYSCMIAHGTWNMIIVTLVYIIWKINL